MSISKDAPLPDSTKVEVSIDEATDSLELPIDVADSIPVADVHTNGSMMNGGGSFPFKAGLNVCLLQHQQRNLTPSPINFCDDLSWGPSTDPIRSLRETSVSSETSIRTADGLLDDDGKASGCSSVSPTHNITSPDGGVITDDSVTSPVTSHDDIQVEVVEGPVVSTEQCMSPPHDESAMDVTSTVETQLSNQTSSVVHTANSPLSTSPPVINIEEDAVKQEVIEEVATVSDVTSNMAPPVVIESAVSSESKEASVVIEPSEKGTREAVLFTVNSKQAAKKESISSVPVVADDDNEMAEQLELMRNHLRHSRGRYSLRHKKRRPRQVEAGDTGSLDRRSEGSGDHGNSPGLQRSATISGARRAYLKGLYGKSEGVGTSTDSRRKTAAQGVFAVAVARCNRFFATVSTNIYAVRTFTK